jgi:hypothetical protein
MEEENILRRPHIVGNGDDNGDDDTITFFVDCVMIVYKIKLSIKNVLII